MKGTKAQAREREALWSHQNAEWRNPLELATLWYGAGRDVDPRMLQFRFTGEWWDVVAATRATLLVTREYEHLLMGLTVAEGKPLLSYMQLPHPSGISVDVQQQTVRVVSSRNPNVLFELQPMRGLLNSGATAGGRLGAADYYRLLMVRRAWFFPGSFYMHDLAMIGDSMCANAVGQNAVIRLDDDGTFERVWWPRCIERGGRPDFSRNYIQLNSIAAGKSIQDSCFSASSHVLSRHQPGDKRYLVDRRGVIFSGATREPIVFGLTRPHSARLASGRLFVNNSGYGELVVAQDESFEVIARLPGWTRGLAIHEHIAFVGTSHVLPRFEHYAPGLDTRDSECGIHAVSIKTGQILGSIFWPYGNQVFAVELAPQSMTRGFPDRVGSRRHLRRERTLYYGFLHSPEHGRRLKP